MLKLYAFNRKQYALLGGVGEEKKIMLQSGQITTPHELMTEECVVQGLTDYTHEIMAIMRPVFGENIPPEQIPRLEAQRKRVDVWDQRDDGSVAADLANVYDGIVTEQFIKKFVHLSKKFITTVDQMKNHNTNPKRIIKGVDVPDYWEKAIAGVDFPVDCRSEPAGTVVDVNLRFIRNLGFALIHEYCQNYFSPVEASEIWYPSHMGAVRGHKKKDNKMIAGIILKSLFVYQSPNILMNGNENTGDIYDKSTNKMYTIDFLQSSVPENLKETSKIELTFIEEDFPEKKNSKNIIMIVDHIRLSKLIQYCFEALDEILTKPEKGVDNKKRDNKEWYNDVMYNRYIPNITKWHSLNNEKELTDYWGEKHTPWISPKTQIVSGNTKSDEIKEGTRAATYKEFVSHEPFDSPDAHVLAFAQTEAGSKAWAKHQAKIRAEDLARAEAEDLVPFPPLPTHASAPAPASAPASAPVWDRPPVPPPIVSQDKQHYRHPHHSLEKGAQARAQTQARAAEARERAREEEARVQAQTRARQEEAREREAQERARQEEAREREREREAQERARQEEARERAQAQHGDSSEAKMQNQPDRHPYNRSPEEGARERAHAHAQTRERAHAHAQTRERAHAQAQTRERARERARDAQGSFDVHGNRIGQHIHIRQPFKHITPGFENYGTIGKSDETRSWRK
jgi:hypothetical protein